MRSGHYNHQRHAQQQAEFFARVEAERRVESHAYTKEEMDALMNRAREAIASDLKQVPKRKETPMGDTRTYEQMLSEAVLLR